jgi:hypothetical protein
VNWDIEPADEAICCVAWLHCQQFFLKIQDSPWPGGRVRARLLAGFIVRLKNGA